MSTKDDGKRARERFFLDEFLRHVPGLRFVEHGRPPEWPDFVLADDRGPLGLELTQLFRDDGPKGSPTVTAEKRRSKLLRDIAGRYYAAGGPPAHVSAVRIGQPEGSNIDDAVRLLLKAAARVGNASERIEVPDRARPTRTPWALLYFLRLAPEVGAHCDWNALQNSCAFVGRVKPEALRACIDEKAANLSRYRRHLDRVSLLIYVERNRGSGMIEPPRERLRLDGAGFESVYLLQRLRVGGPPLLRIDAGEQGLAPGPSAL